MAGSSQESFQLPCTCTAVDCWERYDALEKDLNDFLSTKHKGITCTELLCCPCYKSVRGTKNGYVGSWVIDLAHPPGELFTGKEKILKKAVSAFKGKIEGISTKHVRVRVICTHVHMMGPDHPRH